MAKCERLRLRQEPEQVFSVRRSLELQHPRSLVQIGGPQPLAGKQVTGVPVPGHGLKPVNQSRPRFHRMSQQVRAHRHLSIACRSANGSRSPSIRTASSSSARALAPKPPASRPAPTAAPTSTRWPRSRLALREHRSPPATNRPAAPVRSFMNAPAVSRRPPCGVIPSRGGCDAPNGIHQ